MLSYALIGCGRIAKNHIAAAISQQGLRIAAVCDIVPERMDAMLALMPEEIRKNVSKYGDYQQMLVNTSPDLCAIATESGKHAAIAIDCIYAGANIIIEKPIALSLDDADEIIRLGYERGVKVCACHQNRFNKSIQKIREASEAGRFGRLYHGTAHIRWNRGRDYYKQASWRGTWAQDGGVLMNQCMHNIDLLRWIMGDEIVEVVGMTDRLCHDYIETEDLGVALIRFTNGSFGIVEGTTNIFPHNLEETLYIFGEKGTAKAGGKSVNVIEEWLFADNLDDAEAVKNVFGEYPEDVYGFGHTPLYTDVVNAIQNDMTVYIDAHSGRRALELVLAIYKSAAEGRAVKLPLENCSTLDFVGQF